MTELSLLQRIRVVLVQPKSPGNVGSVARICANAGLGPIRLVGRVDGLKGDVRILGHLPSEGGWQPWRMELWQGGRRVLQFDAERVESRAGRR